MFPVLNALLLSAVSFLAPPPVVLDGSFEDWTIDPVLTDAEDALEGAALDIRSVSVGYDAERVYFLFDLGKVVTAQVLAGRLELVLDADGKEKTGTEEFGMAGVDMVVEFTTPSRKGDRPDMGVGLILADGSRRSPYDAGVMFAPTYASDRIEVSIERGKVFRRLPAIFKGKSFRGKLVLTDARGKVQDETDVFSQTLKAGKKRIMKQSKDPLARADDSLRVVSWNVEFGAIFKKPEPFARVLQALDPEVLLFQELQGKNTGEQLESWLNTHLAKGEDTPWRVVFGEGGGPLRCAVASYLPLKGAKGLEKVQNPDRPDRSLRVAGAVVETDKGKVLVSSIHLKCCGSIGSREDRIRMMETKVLAKEIAKAMRRGKVKGVVVMGDFNLVGSDEPLHQLSRMISFRRAPLVIANPMQLDGLSNTTWSDDHQPFVPGRLDFALYSDASLKLTQKFVFEAADLSKRWIKHHGLKGGDSAVTSDHFPVVLDFEWSGQKTASPPTSRPDTTPSSLGETP